MFSELLAEERVADAAKQRSYLQIITAEAARLTRLINNVLDFSRMERGEKKYNFAAVRFDGNCPHDRGNIPPASRSRRVQIRLRAAGRADSRSRRRRCALASHRQPAVQRGKIFQRRKGNHIATGAKAIAAASRRNQSSGSRRGRFRAAARKRFLRNFIARTIR